jgi:diguanylate cyclase (GGDEF)-like protein
MEQSVSSLQATLNGINQGILAVYSTGESPFLNRQFVEMWEIPDEVIALEDYEAQITYISSKLPESATFLEKVRELEDNPLAEYRELWELTNGKIFELLTQPLYLETEIIGRIWHSQDVTAKIQTETTWRRQLESLKQDLLSLNLIDDLTQIGNRRRFDQQLEQEWQRLAREKQPLSVIICDLDYFKLYNDACGLPGGDSCLQQIAWALSLAINRPADLVARIGGEEFGIILPNTDRKGAVFIAEKIRQNVASLNIVHPKSPIGSLLTISCGVSCLVPNLAFLPKYLMAAAEKALYQAKAKGGDRIIFSEVSY